MNILKQKQIPDFGVVHKNNDLMHQLNAVREVHFFNSDSSKLSCSKSGGIWDVIDNNYYLTQAMKFSDYSQFLDNEAGLLGYPTHPSEEMYAEGNAMFYRNSPSKSSDHAYTEFSQIVAKRLCQLQYPTSFTNSNPFCPLCLQFVRNEDIFVTCYLRAQRHYLIHQECLLKNPAFELSSIPEQLQSVTNIQEMAENPECKYEHGIDSREFYVELWMCHPISEAKFMKINKKCTLMRNHFKITLKQSDQDSFFPNILCFPLTDFNLVVSISEVGNPKNKLKLKKYINLRNSKIQKSDLIINCQNLRFQARIINDKQQKADTVQKMNYRFKYSLNTNMAFLRILSFDIDLPQQFEDLGEDCTNENNSTILEDILNQKEEYECSTIKSSDHLNELRSSPTSKKKNKTNNYLSAGSNDSSSQFEHSSDHKQINLDYLIQSNKLIEFVKSNTQSRQFQTYLGEAPQQEMNLIINNLQMHFPELIMHQYGNYMTQKLFSVCSLPQRLRILNILTKNIPDIAKNKQGTHTLQAFIALFITHEEYTIMCEQLKQDFYEMSRNSNSTHFVQKIIKIFPLNYTIEFYLYAAENLVAFALDKNAMCVIKHMMRKLKEVQENSADETMMSIMENIRKQFIKHVTFNVDRLIVDCYGNYVIQFFYELVDLERCAGITQRILSKFVEYSNNKFSCNVVHKCISMYCNNKHMIQSLKNILNTANAIQLYRNQNGNKVLLQIMERYEGTQAWDRLYNILIQTQPTRYFHDRWGACLGSRSGNVGTKWTSFTDATKKKFNSSKNCKQN